MDCLSVLGDFIGLLKARKQAGLNIQHTNWVLFFSKLSSMQMFIVSFIASLILLPFAIKKYRHRYTRITFLVILENFIELYICCLLGYLLTFLLKFLIT